jgi:hypothetical protein
VLSLEVDKRDLHRLTHLHEDTVGRYRPSHRR